MGWYVARGGKVAGPVGDEQVITFIREGYTDAQIRHESGGDWAPIMSSPFAHAAPKQSVVTKAAASASRIVWGVLVAIGGTFIVIMSVVWLARWLNPPAAANPMPETPRPVVAAPPEPVRRAPTVQERLDETKALWVAISVLKPLFSDTVNETDAATKALAVWGSEHMTWPEIQALPETKRALVMKDSDPERGKRLCASGTLSEIQADRSAGEPIYVGGLMTPSADVVRFYAVGSSGNLVADSVARICGVVTGRVSYSNAIGGTTHAVFVVGMFDIPENTRAKIPLR